MYRQLLGSSTSQLCKTIVFENLACTRDDCAEATNSRFYCVIVQYEARFDAEKLRTFIHSLNAETTKLPKKKFNFQLASAEVSDRLTGFTHNAVTPFGMLHPIPVCVHC